MSRFTPTRTSQDANAFVKQSGDTPSYKAERNALQELSGTGIAPEILWHNNSTRTIRIEDAGITLRSLRLDHNHVLSVSQIRRVASGLFGCLTTLHAENFCHYDVKEDNICIQAYVGVDGSVDLDEDFRVKLIDFGLSFKIDSIPRHYVGNKSIGTPVCRSPEHINGLPEYGQAADVFCAAATVLQLIEDAPDAFPLALGNPERQIQVARERVEPTRTLRAASGEIVPKDIQLALFSMLNPDPNERPSSKTCYYLLGLAV